MHDLYNTNKYESYITYYSKNLFVIKLFFELENTIHILIWFYIIISDLFWRAVGSPGCPTVCKRESFFNLDCVGRSSIQEPIVLS